MGSFKRRPLLPIVATATEGSREDLYQLGAEDGWSGAVVRQGYGLRTWYMDGYANGQAFRKEEDCSRALGVAAKPLTWYLS